MERKVARSPSRERAVICADVLGTALGIRAASRALQATRGRKCVDVYPIGTIHIASCH